MAEIKNIPPQTGNWFVDKLSLYQSANSDNASIKSNFVIRQAEFELIISALKNKAANDPLQHELVLGRRGSGKSTLLRRIQAEIEEDEALQKKYIAINLAEEQAGIYRLFDLWEEITKELKTTVDPKLVVKEYNEFENDNEYTRYLYSVIHDALKQHNKKAVLLLDNFDRVVCNFSEEGHLLREILLNNNDIAIIAGSTRMDEHFWQYDQPFYEFFRRHRLEALDIKEIIELLNHWGEVMQLPQLSSFAKNNIGKLETIRILTDGLPRTLQFFIQILLQNSDLYGYDYLRKVMDNVTALYQERLNNLTPPQRKIIAEMAFIWEACATKELVEKCRMESKLISANIKQLSNAGIVDTITTEKKNHLYRISERFFNMWLIVTQGNPEQKRKARWLSIFLETWYDAVDLKKLAEEHIENLKNKKIGYDKALILTKAFAQSRFVSIWQRDELIEQTKALQPSEQIFNFLELPKKSNEFLKEINKLKNEKKYKEAHIKIDEIENEEDGIKYAFHAILFQEAMLFDEAEKNYLLAIEKHNYLAAYNLANLYEKMERFEKAEEYFLLAINQNINQAINNLAILYQNQSRFDEAERFYLLAIQKEQDTALYNLANLYLNQQKFTDAEKYYLLAIEKNQSEAFNNLAGIYYTQQRFDEAIKYYLLAIENKRYEALHNLANLYYDQQKFADAEKYYLLAIEKEAFDAIIDLATLYEELKEFTKAEACYLYAIEKGNLNAYDKIALFYFKRFDFLNAEKYILLDIEKGNNNANYNLISIYYFQNIKKEIALELVYSTAKPIQQTNIEEIVLIIEIWNGLLKDLNDKIEKVLIDKNYTNLDWFLLQLVFHQQLNIVANIFSHHQHGPELKKRYTPFYYAIQLLRNKAENNLELKIPPEIHQTVNEIIDEIKRGQEFYSKYNQE